MLKIVWILLLFQSYIFSLDINNNTTVIELLSHSEIYKDYSREENISTIQNKEFKPINQKILGCGYSPKYDVWIKFTLTNRSSHSIEKIIEYANPLTSYIKFFEENKLVRKDGQLNISKNRQSLNPIFKVKLKPHQSKEFYIKASSKITTLIIKLNVWDSKIFEQNERNKQIVLALFFGAMGITILYNFIIFILTGERSYLHYVLFFITTGFHHFIYKGVATLYFPPIIMNILINCSSCIVAMPTVALALFTHNIIKLEQYPKLNRGLIILLVLYPLFIILIHFTHLYEYRNLFFIIILIYLFVITIYALKHKNHVAYRIFIGWFLFVTSGIFMQLSSLGKYNAIFEEYSYYVEVSLIIVIGIFSSLLASKIKTLNREKLRERLNAQNNKFRLKELNHRIKNSMQTILSMIDLQKDKIEDKKTEDILTSLEKRIMATTKLYSLLEIKDNITVVDTYRYFSLIVKNLQKSFTKEDIIINIKSSITMNSEYAIYLGLIVNEAVNNSLKYANCNNISISFSQQQEYFQLSIEDNGNGFINKTNDGLGLSIINTLATLQLDGELDINSHNGVKINIKWRSNQ